MLDNIKKEFMDIISENYMKIIKDKTDINVFILPFNGFYEVLTEKDKKSIEDVTIYLSKPYDALLECNEYAAIPHVFRSKTRDLNIINVYNIKKSLPKNNEILHLKRKSLFMMKFKELLNSFEYVGDHPLNYKQNMEIVKNINDFKLYNFKTFNGFSFYNNNNSNIIKPLNNNKDGNNLKILSYNVRCFKNIISTINTDKNMDDIVHTIKSIGWDIIVLQEVYNSQIDKLKKMMNEYNLFHVLNGHKSMSIILLVNKKLKNIIVESIDFKVLDLDRPRGYHILTIDNKKLVFTHIEVAMNDMTYHKYSINSRKYQKGREEATTAKKINIEDILKHSPSLIMGDFNFDPVKDKVLDRMFKNINYTLEDKNKNNSSIYNSRVDLCYYKDKDNNKNKDGFSIVDSQYSKCNYSDHLPYSIILNKN